MNQPRSRNRADNGLRQYDYPEATVLAVDLRTDLQTGEESVSVDTVGETAIVVVGSGADQREFEFDLPGEAASVDTKNGVLTIEVER